MERQQQDLLRCRSGDMVSPRRRWPRVTPTGIQLAARWTVPRKRSGATNVSSSSSGWRWRTCQSALMRRAQSERNREPRFGRRSGRSNRTLFTIRCSRPNCSRRLHPIQTSRALHLRADAEKAASADHEPVPRSASRDPSRPLIRFRSDATMGGSEGVVHPDRETSGRKGESRTERTCPVSYSGSRRLFDTQ